MRLRPEGEQGLFPQPAAPPPPAVDAIGWVKVAVERGMDRYPDGLTYALPSEHEGVAPGDRVLVPLGGGARPVPGWVVDRLDAPDLPPERCRPIAGLDREGLQLPRTLMRLGAWTSGYYAAPLGMVLQAMIPAAVKRATGRVRRTFVDLAEGVDAAAIAGTLPRGQRAAIDVLAALPAEARPLDVRTLADQAGLRTTGPIHRLIERDLLATVQRSSVEARWRGHAADARAPQTLTAAQERVLDDLLPRMDAGFSAHLLFGVTGSGKTEIYIRLIERALAKGRTALVLVPEIALTPQTGARLLGRFPDRRVAILHSGLTAAQRHQQWSLAARGEADVVLGARSAVFAPIPDDRLGLLIVDEEHDGSFKSGQAPRYHGRDVAVRLAQLAACPVVLGSATPSLESWRHATVTGRLALHRLPERVPGTRLPEVRVVHLRDEERETASPSTPEVERQLGPALARALSRTLAEGGQAILLLNRRGWASYLACPNRRCGWTARCPHCDVSVVLHVDERLPAGGLVRCHHCQAESRLPRTCPDCGGAIRRLRPGTQRLEDVLRRAFPVLAEGGSLARVDADTMRTGARHHDVMTRFADGRIRVLAGTQMIAKGLDVPGVRLVGVIDADTSLALPDFRAAERTFQLVSQVAGRCGRGTSPGLVIVRTLHPNDPAIERSARHDYEGFAQRELALRDEAGLPPARRMVRIVARDPDEEVAEGLAERIATGLEADARAITAKAGAEGCAVEVLPAVPCPVARVADHFRFEVLLMADGPGPLQALLARARSRGGLGPAHRVAVDVDPIAVL